MGRFWSWIGAVLALLYAVALGALYVHYLRQEGAFLADLPLALAALPFTLTMRALNGGSYAFAGDMTGRVAAAILFCSTLAYLIGFAVEAILRLAIRAARRL